MCGAAGSSLRNSGIGLEGTVAYDDRRRMVEGPKELGRLVLVKRVGVRRMKERRWNDIVGVSRGNGWS